MFMIKSERTKSIRKILMDDFPLISVVMPAYNSEKFIAEAINSVLNQNYQPIELIIIDDGSTDNTSKIIKKFGHLVRLIQQNNAGPAAARNKGVFEAKGELLAFIDADDVWHPEKLLTQVSYLKKNPNIGICFGRKFEWIPDKLGNYPARTDFSLIPCSEKIIKNQSGWIYPQMLLSSVIHIVSALIRRDVWEKLGGMDEHLRCGEDYDFFIRASRIVEVAAIDQYLSWYRKHPSSITYRARPEVDEADVVLSAIERFGTTGTDGRKVDEKTIKTRLAKIYFDHGYMNFWRGDPFIAYTSFKKALKYRKNRITKTITYCILSIIKYWWIILIKNKKFKSK